MTLDSALATAMLNYTNCLFGVLERDIKIQW